MVATATATATAKKTVLCVDDERNVISSIGRLVRPMGYQFVGVVNPIEGLEIISKHTPQLILLDAKMPEVSGYDFMRLLRSNGESIPVVMITGDRHSARGFYEGCALYIDKPYDPHQIRQVLRYFLDDSLSETQRARLALTF